MNLSGTSRLPTTIHDYLDWKYYDKIKKNEFGLSIPFLNNPIHFRHYTAWHIKYENYEHTLKFRMLKAIQEDDINTVKYILD